MIPTSVNALEERLQTHLHKLDEHKKTNELDALEQALVEGKISRREYDFFLESEYGIQAAAPTETKIWPTVIVATSLLLLLGIGAMFLEGGITGFVVIDFEETIPVGETFTESSTYTLTASNTTTIKVSGTLSGQVVIYAQSENTTWLVYNASTEELPGIWMEKNSYGLNETIQFYTIPEDDYSYWLDDGNKTPVVLPLTLSEAGDYTLEAISNTTKLTQDFTVRNDTDASEDAIGPTLSFTDACSESCTIPQTSNVTLIITVTEGTTFVLDAVTVTTQRTNSPPELLAEIPDVELNGSALLDLSQYFIDVDGDDISYELNNIVGIEETIEGSALSLVGSIPGEYQATIYASDLVAVTQAEFTITVGEIEPEVVEENITNTNTTSTETTNQTPEQTNQTDNAKTNPGQEKKLDGCEHPNVNKRPPECFGDQFSDAFSEVIAPLKDKNLNQVARFTRLGNLVITGEVIENSDAQPGNNDFAVGFSEQQEFRQEFIPTAWIDATGNLHLTGQLYEERIDLEAPQFDSYAVRNSNGIVLGYFDEVTGDLYLRGNVVTR